MYVRRGLFTEAKRSPAGNRMQAVSVRYRGNHPRRPLAIILTDKVDSITGDRIYHLLAIMSAHRPW